LVRGPTIHETPVHTRTVFNTPVRNTPVFKGSTKAPTQRLRSYYAGTQFVQQPIIIREPAPAPRQNATSYEPGAAGGIRTPETAHTTIAVLSDASSSPVLFDVIRGERSTGPYVPQVRRAPPPQPAPAAVVPASREVETVDATPSLFKKIDEAVGPSDLVEYLDHSDPRVQNRAAEAMLQHAAGRALLSQAMEGGSPRARAAATWALRNEDPTPEDIERLNAGLRDRDAIVRRVSARVAGMWGKQVLPTAQAGLVDALADGDESVRQAASEALSQLGEAGVPLLVAQLSSAQEERAREAASRALIQAGAVSVGPLQEALTSESPVVRYWAAHSLGNLGRPAMVALPTLKKMAASDPDSTVRFYSGAAQRKLER
jgi:hypothetical protein